MHSELFRLHAELEETHWWFVARRMIMRSLIQKLLPPSPGALIVDVGCGTGANIAALRDAYICIGVDPEGDAIALAEERYSGVRFLQGLAPQVLGSDASRADLFLLMDVLEHVEDDSFLLSSLLANAKPGTLFLITVPADMALWSAHDDAFGHFRRYDADRLRGLWSELPVSTLLLSHFNSRLYPVIRAVRTMTNLRGGTFGRGGTDLRLPSSTVNGVLTRVFAGEAPRLEAALERRAKPYRVGASLIAVIRRNEGTMQARGKPAKSDVVI